MITFPEEDYNPGLRSAIVGFAAVNCAVKRCADNMLFCSNAMPPNGADALNIRRLAEDLEQTARTLREAAGLAYRAPALVAAE